MMLLRSSSASPFGRKVSMALQVLGLQDRVRVEKADTTDAGDSLRQQNPLGKIPTLVLDDGETLFDSRVIVDYLDELDGRHVLIPPGAARLDALRQQALFDGLLDAAILQMYEKRFRPEAHHVQSWLDHQQGKVARALDHAESRYLGPVQGLPHIGQITQAAALGYLDFRFGGQWRGSHPRLAAWLADFARQVPAFDATAPQA